MVLCYNLNEEVLHAMQISNADAMKMKREGGGQRLLILYQCGGAALFSF
jgi:hypothetical protein